MAKITYADKAAINQNANIQDINKVNASDMNEIKNVVNNNYDEFTNGSGWINLPLASGITQYSTATQYKCQYRKIGNQVFVRGCVKGVSAGNATITTLPVGYRPTTTARYVNGYNTTKGGTILAYETDGDILFVGYTSGAAVANTDFIYIQISFFID